jgi:hypothetical protein
MAHGWLSSYRIGLNTKGHSLSGFTKLLFNLLHRRRADPILEAITGLKGNLDTS